MENWNRKRDEQAAKQRQREEEALERRKAQKAEPRPIERPAIGVPESAGSGERPPRLALVGVGGKPSWRDREQRKGTGGGGDMGSDGDQGGANSGGPRNRLGATGPRGRLLDLPDGGGSAKGSIPPRNLHGLSARDGSPADSLGSRPGSSYAHGPTSSRDESPATSGGGALSSKFAGGDPRGRIPRDESPADTKSIAGSTSGTGARGTSGTGAGRGGGAPEKYRPGAFRGRRGA